MLTPIEQIKEKIDIVEFIRSYIPLQPAGKNFKALCPFHKEKTPSFIVSPERQTWHCFGACGEGGDIFKFLMKYENLEFYEALKVLAEKAGVELKRISPADQKQFGILYDINESAKDFFKKELGQFPEVLKYLFERGLKKETIEEFELGFAANNFDNLARHLINFGYDAKDIERAGLIFKTEKGTYVDRFRGRIMFPIYNYFGKTVGFSGRILPQFDTGESGKYVNSPETPIFSKSRILYGFHKAKKNIFERKTAVLVEGQMDFLMVWQDGIKNAVATLGTALTPEHLKTLRRITEQIIFCFDNDEAGLKAAERSIDLAAALDFDVKLLILKDYKDPAEAAQKSPGALKSLIDKAESAMEFYFERYLQNADLREFNADKRGNIAEFKKNLRVVLSKIKNLASPVEQAYWLKELSHKTEINEKSLIEEMEHLRNEKEVMSNENEKLNTQNLTLNILTRRELIAQRLLSLIIAEEKLYPQVKDYIEYLPEEYRKIYDGLGQKTDISDDKLKDLIGLLSLRSSFETQNIDEEKINREFQELLKQLRLEYCKERREALSNEIKKAEKSGDEKKLSEILCEFDKLSKMTHN